MEGADLKVICIFVHCVLAPYACQFYFLRIFKYNIIKLQNKIFPTKTLRYFLHRLREISIMLDQFRIQDILK